MDSMKTIYARPSNDIQQLFDRIAGRYDFINSFLSFGLDRAWRKKAVHLSLRSDVKSILDVGTGSGAFLEAYQVHRLFTRACGIDFSEKMLELARKRLGPEAELELAQIPKLSFSNASFDLISSAFVLRSLDQLAPFFSESHRVLKDRGRLVILELTRPQNGILKALYWIYLSVYLPVMGKLISGSFGAYQFLSQSIQKFYKVEEIKKLLHASGFTSVKFHPLSGGICTLIIAEKQKKREA